MIVGNTRFENEVGVFCPAFETLTLSHKYQVTIPTILFQAHQEYTARRLFDFRVQRRNSSRRIIAKCVMGAQCETPRAYLEDTDFFLPAMNRILLLGEKVPAVITHTFGNTFAQRNELKEFVDEYFTKLCVTVDPIDLQTSEL